MSEDAPIKRTKFTHPLVQWMKDLGICKAKNVLDNLQTKWHDLNNSGLCAVLPKCNKSL